MSDPTFAVTVSEDSVNVAVEAPVLVPATTPAFTVAEWEATRGAAPYYIAHRGGGDIAPEHSLAAYDFAYSAGIRALEVSVNMSADGVLYCMHDLTLDRTTGVAGNGRDFPWANIKHLELLAPTLGPAWADDPERAPLFEDILRRFGGNAVLICEAKNDAAYPAMVAMIERYGLKDSAIIKAYFTSSRIAQAKAAGYKVFCYFGTVGDVTTENITTVVAKAPDYFVIPTYDSSNPEPQSLLPDALVDECVATGIPVWVYQTHRRSDRDHMLSRGVVGFVVANPYVARDTALTTRDAWASRALSPGELVRDPGAQNPGVYPTYQAPNIWRFESTSNGGKQFIAVGQVCPVANAEGTYHIDFDWRWNVVPTDVIQHFDIAFGRADDRFYEHQIGVGNGYHFIVRPDGRVQLFAHHDGVSAGTQIGTTGVTMTPPTAGTWYHTRIDVTPTTITATVTDSDGANPHVVTVTDSMIRGGYISLGKSGDLSGQADVRNFVIT